MNIKDKSPAAGSGLPLLSTRLQTAADMVPEGSLCADVGCDHGYTAIWLYASGRCRACIAMDVKEGPLRAARRNVKQYGCGEGVQIRLSDGLAALQKGEADCILITGMGGSLIIRILSEGAGVLKSIKALVLEPQSDADKVRRFLYEMQFEITREALVQEQGKYYPVIRAVPAAGTATLTEAEARYGPCLLRSGDPLLKTFLRRERQRLEEIRKTLVSAGSVKAGSRAAQIEKELEWIDEAEQYF